MEQANFFSHFVVLNSSIPIRASVAEKMDYPLFQRTLQRIKGQTAALTDQEDVRWNIFLSSLQAYLADLVFNTKALSSYKNENINRNELRDSVMALNLGRLAERLYPDKKIIVWAASWHIAKNFTKTTGYFLQKYSTEKIYTIGFTAGTGTIRDFIADKTEDLEPPKPDSFEDLFTKTGMANFFLDFKTNSRLKKGKWLSEPRVMRPFGYVYNNTDWTKNFDAIIFNEKMEPSHLVAK